MTTGSAPTGRHRAASDPTLADFNSDALLAHDVLAACLDIPEWVAQVSAGRPFADLGSLLAAAATASERITWEQVLGALDRHPRIGEQKAAAATTATESAWSSAEQAGVQSAHIDAMAAGNAAYEQRFGHIFLICAAGLSGEQILARLRSRLDNDTETEKAVVMEELRKISALRLAKAVLA